MHLSMHGDAVPARDVCLGRNAWLVTGVVKAITLLLAGISERREPILRNNQPSSHLTCTACSTS